MLRTVIWLALACAVILAALALSRGLPFTSEPAERPVEAPAAERAAEPAAARETAPPARVPMEEPPVELQVEEDAAATGMTTLEPAPAPDPAAPEPPGEFVP